MRNQLSIQLRDYREPLKNCDKVAEYINSLQVIDPKSKEAIIKNSVKNSIVKEHLNINNQRAKFLLQILTNHGFLSRKPIGAGRTSLFFKRKNLTEYDVIEASQY